MKLLTFLICPFLVFAHDYILCNNDVLLFIETVSITASNNITKYSKSY